MERRINHGFQTTCKAFLWKTVKEKQYYYKRNLFWSLFPIVLVLSSQVLIDKFELKKETNQNDGTFKSETEVSMAMTGIFVNYGIQFRPYYFREIYVE
jgi:hypothetical protein